MQSNLVQTCLRGATFLNRLLLPVQVEALPEPKPSIVELLATSGASLDTTVWSLKMIPKNQQNKTIRKFVSLAFKELAQSSGGSGDPAETGTLTSSDMEAFLVACISSTAEPAGIGDVETTQLQREFYKARII